MDLKRDNIGLIPLTEAEINSGAPTSVQCVMKDDNVVIDLVWKKYLECKEEYSKLYNYFIFEKKVRNLTSGKMLYNSDELNNVLKELKYITFMEEDLDTTCDYLETVINEVLDSKEPFISLDEYKEKYGAFNTKLNELLKLEIKKLEQMEDTDELIDRVDALEQNLIDSEWRLEDLEDTYDSFVDESRYERDSIYSKVYDEKISPIIKADSSLTAEERIMFTKSSLWKNMSPNAKEEILSVLETPKTK